MNDKQLQQLKTWIDENHKANLKETLATWEHTRETISSNMINDIKKLIREEFKENEELKFLRNIGSFWSVSGFLMKGVIFFSAFATAVIGILVLINKVLHSVDK